MVAGKRNRVRSARGWKRGLWVSPESVLEALGRMETCRQRNILFSSEDILLVSAEGEDGLQEG